ncbi:unnamed protein product [Durusdinium trenchii]|uniref:Uncharacterized protein n=1 Tax=Durusdinium trenchii TaxID=1381693 RepID=A0ABP0ITY2_9DINO
MSLNFTRQMLLLIFATNPDSLFDAEDEAAKKAPEQSLALRGSERLQQSAALAGEYLRAIYAVMIWTGWNLAQFFSDYDHLAGNIRPSTYHNMHFPFSEFPMFAPTKETTYAMWSCALLLLAWGGVLIKMIHDVNEAMPP